MPDQEFLASFGVQIDESGVNRLQQALEQNRTLAEELAAAFDHAREAVTAFFRELSESSFTGADLNAARVTEEQQGLTLLFSLDFTKANKELSAFVKSAGKALKLNADASAVIAAGQDALSQLYLLFASTVLPLQVSLQASGTTAPAAGVASGLASALSSLPSLLSTPAVSAPVTNNASKNISAPVSIQVTAAGSDPEAVGRSVYDVTEQYLLRTLNSQF